MKKVSKLAGAGAAVLALTVSGLAAAGPAAASGSGSGQSGPVKVSVSATDVFTGANPDLYRNAAQVIVDVPDDYLAGGMITTRHPVYWVPKAWAEGDPGCAGIHFAPSRPSVSSDGVVSMLGVIYDNTVPSACTLKVQVTAQRGITEAQVNEVVTVSVPWSVRARTRVGTPAVSSSKVVRGSTVTVSGKAEAYVGYRSTKVPLAKQKVVVQSRVGKGAWKNVRTVTTSTSGTWKTTVKPTATTAYRAVVLNAKLYSSSTSGSRTVTAVAPPASKAATPKASVSKVKKGKSVKVTGAVTVKKGKKYVAASGAVVSVQARAKGAKTWKTIKTVKTSKSGTWSVTTKPSKTTSYRAVVKASTKVAASTSGARTVSVR